MKTWHWLLLGGGIAAWAMMKKKDSNAGVLSTVARTEDAQKAQTQQVLDVVNLLKARLAKAGVAADISATWTGAGWQFIDINTNKIMLEAKTLDEAKALIASI